MPSSSLFRPENINNDGRTTVNIAISLFVYVLYKATYTKIDHVYTLLKFTQLTLR